MTREQALEKLIAKVEAGGFDAPPSSARAPFFNAFMDIAEIALPQNVTGCSALAWRAYNGSLDAAMALHEAVLVGWRYFGGLSVVSDGYLYTVYHPEFYDCEAASNTNPARAWLLAILKALSAKEGKP